MRSLISVCLPVFNRGATLRSALDSIYNQSTQPYEVVICDFSSDDNSVEVIERWILDAPLPGCNILFKKNYKKPIFAEDWNITISQASGEYVAILEGDDAFPYNYLEKAQAVIDKYKDIGLLIYPSFNENGVKLWKTSGAISAKSIKNKFNNMELFAAPSQAIYKRLNNSGDQILYNDKRYLYAPEMELYIRLMKQYKRAYIFNDSAVYRGIGVRKRIIPLYYKDHFELIVYLLELKDLNRIKAFTLSCRLFLITLIRILKRLLDGSQLAKKGDVKILFIEYKKYVKKIFQIEIIRHDKQ